MQEADVRVIFTDLQAGSCTMASRRILRGMDDAVLDRRHEPADAARLRVCRRSDGPRGGAPRGGARTRGDHGARSRRVTLELYRIDDRLIHGQVVVGWGQPLDIDFIVLVDDTVATSDWEQELYRMGVPPEMDVYFHTATTRSARIPKYQRRSASRLAARPATSRRCAD